MLVGLDEEVDHDRAGWVSISSTALGTSFLSRQVMPLTPNASAIAAKFGFFIGLLL